MLTQSHVGNLGRIKCALPQTKLRVLGSRPFIASITSNQGVLQTAQKAWSREAAIMRIRQTIKLSSVTRHRQQQRRKEHSGAVVTSFAFMRTAKLGTGDIQEHQEQEHQEYQEQEHQEYQDQEHHWHQPRRKEHFFGAVVTSFAFMRTAELGTGRDIQERNRGTKGFPISSLCHSVPFLKDPDHVFSDRG